MSESKSGRGLVVALIIFILISIALAGYIVYDKVIDKNDNETKEVEKKESKKEEKKEEEKKETKKDNKEYKSTFSLDSESGIAYVEGYASKEHVQGGGMYSSEDEEEEYVFFNILNTDSDDFMEYIEDSKGNSYVGDKAIGIGCISGNNIKYYNSSDEESVDTEYNEYKLDKETTNKILKSSKDYPITLKLERKEFTGGGAAPLCYSHITHVSVVE